MKDIIKKMNNKVLSQYNKMQYCDIPDEIQQYILSFLCITNLKSTMRLNSKMRRWSKSAIIDKIELLHDITRDITCNNVHNITHNITQYFSPMLVALDISRIIAHDLAFAMELVIDRATHSDHFASIIRAELSDAAITVTKEGKICIFNLFLHRAKCGLLPEMSMQHLFYLAIFHNKLLFASRIWRQTNDAQKCDIVETIKYSTIVAIHSNNNKFIINQLALFGIEEDLRDFVFKDCYYRGELEKWVAANLPFIADHIEGRA